MTLKFRKLIPWLIVLLWMMVIFNLSAQPAHESDQLSKSVTKTVVKTVEQVAPEMKPSVNELNHLVRKNAHFFVYLVLAILLLFALEKSGVTGVKSVLIALEISILYAISDEIHQLFVSGRGAQVKDVMIDSAGAMVGICLYLLIRKAVRKSF